MKEYTDSTITVVWKPDLCIHSKNCTKGLPEVFNPKERPWVKMDAATSERIREQVELCPSGALSYFYNDTRQNMEEKAPVVHTDNIKVKVIEKGPLMVEGAVEVVDKDGNVTIRDKATALCRCGLSSNKPYCNGAHKNFDGW